MKLVSINVYLTNSIGQDAIRRVNRVVGKIPPYIDWGYYDHFGVLVNWDVPLRVVSATLKEQTKTTEN